MSTGPDNLLTASEVCAMLGGVSRAWLNDHAAGRRRPYMPAVQMGKVRRYRREDVTAFVEDCLRIAGEKPREGKDEDRMIRNAP